MPTAKATKTRLDRTSDMVGKAGNRPNTHHAGQSDGENAFASNPDHCREETEQ
jgi:hypothetical protein